MSTSSARRLKERGTAGSNVPPSKPLKTPTSLSQNFSGSDKENSGSSSKVAAFKPAIRPIPRIEKPIPFATSNINGESKTRRSASSVPRGRSASPADFTRVLSDLRKEQNSRRSASSVSLDGNGRSLSRGRKVSNGSDFSSHTKVVRDSSVKRAERSDNETKILRSSSNTVNHLVKLVKKKEKQSDLESGLKSDKCKQDVALGLSLSKSNVKCRIDRSEDRVNAYSHFNDQNFVEDSEKIKGKSCLSQMSDAPIEKAINGVSSSLNTVVQSASICLKGLDVKKGEGLANGVGAKYPSKLHERLAYLEGKANRIASDIKQTKEMLAINNPDASKLILTDIQEKILGIEKAIDCVGGDSIVDMVPVKISRDESGLNKEIDQCADKQDAKWTYLDKERSSEETSSSFNDNRETEIILTTNETIDEFDDQENRQDIIMDGEIEDESLNQLYEIGCKISTAGWFVSEGESVVLAHDDGSCTFYDIANCETKAEYMPPTRVPSNIWKDCWIIRAPDADGCSGKYVVAASAGNNIDSGFCSWDFYNKNVRAFHIVNSHTAPRTVLAPLPNNSSCRTNRQCWYKPCGPQPLIVSSASCQKVVKVFDIRDGEQVLKWETQKPVLKMDYSSPLHWRNRGKVVIAEEESISLWDVSSLNPQALVSVSLAGQKISALHVNNTDAELGGGVRQRVSSLEAEGNDGVVCTAESISVLDFRNPSGLGLKIPKANHVHAQAVFSRGDSIFVGCTSAKGNKYCSQVQQFSMRKQRSINTYTLPDSNATSITQVWGKSHIVMSVCQTGLFVFDAMEESELQSQRVRETIGPDDLCLPSFDYSSSRALLISRDRPAMWRHLS